MSTLLRRDGQVLQEDEDGDIQAEVGAYVTAFAAGAICRGSSVTSGNTTIPVYTGHGIAANDNVMINLDPDTLAFCISVTSNTILVSGGVTSVTGDVIHNLGTDSGTAGEPGYDGSEVVIYSTPDTTTAITDSEVVTDGEGEYGYWHPGTAPIWELIRNAAGTPIAYVLDVVSQQLVGPGSSTDLAAARFDGATGRLLQNSVVIIQDNGDVTGIADLTITDDLVVGDDASVAGDLAVTGAATVGTTLGVTGNTTVGGTLGVTGATSLGAASVSSTLAVTGATTLTGAVTTTGGIVGGTPRNAGTWSNTAATSGTDTACSNGTVYVGSVRIDQNCTVTGIQYLIGSVGGTTKVVVSLHDSSGAVVANSATAGTTVGTLATIQRVAFTAPYAAKGPNTFFVGLTFDGTTAKFRSIPAVCNGNGVVGDGLAQTFGTPASITPPTTFVADKVPVAALY